MARKELYAFERQVIEDTQQANAPVAKIARKLSRHRSTIYCEIRRNRFVDEEWPAVNGYALGQLLPSYAP